MSMADDLEKLAESLSDATAQPQRAMTSPKLSDTGRLMAEAVAKRSRREQIPVRNSFVRAETPTDTTPLARMARTQGRGGEVKIKLYLGLVWLSVSPPYNTSLPAARWAALLDLEDPEAKGARRIRKALSELEDLGMVLREEAPGAPSRIQLLREDGSGRKYTLPSTAYSTARKGKEAGERYFKVPAMLWTTGHIQRMSSAALTMLLIVLEESRAKGTPQWWTGQLFGERFGISKDVRAKGTKELVARRLIEVNRQSVPTAPGQNALLSARRVRHTYRVTNEAAGLTPAEANERDLAELKLSAVGKDRLT